MRKLLTFLLYLTILSSFGSCGILKKVFKPKDKYGCPSNGKNVGAEKIISGDPDAMKAMKKAKKFKS
jgi:hypothetical protein